VFLPISLQTGSGNHTVEQQLPQNTVHQGKPRGHEVGSFPESLILYLVRWGTFYPVYKVQVLKYNSICQHSLDTIFDNECHLYHLYVQ
jgi:hypothetical protein